MVNMVKKEGWHLQMTLFSTDMNIFMMFVNNKELSSNWSHLHQFVEFQLIAGRLSIIEFIIACLEKEFFGGFTDLLL